MAKVTFMDILELKNQCLLEPNYEIYDLDKHTPIFDLECHLGVDWNNRPSEVRGVEHEDGACCFSLILVQVKLSASIFLHVSHRHSSVHVATLKQRETNLKNKPSMSGRIIIVHVLPLTETEEKLLLS